MDRMTFKKKPLNTQRPRVDRFLVPRYDFPELCRRASWSTMNKADDIWTLKNTQQKKYVDRMNEAFGLEPLKSQARYGDCVQLWPCIPRKKRHLSSAENVLDLPSYSYATFPELLDWSSYNILVAALGTSYHKWSWSEQKLMSHGRTEFNIQCCKFDPSGKLLTFGSQLHQVEVHNVELNKCVNLNCCTCISEHQNCSVTAIDWSPTGNAFVTGCTRGRIVTFTKSAVIIGWTQVKRNPIWLVKISPNARFVTVTTTNDDDVLILTWPSLTVYACLNSNWKIKSLCWHPWRSALLGIGAAWFKNEEFNTKVTLWDVNARKVRKHTLDRRHHSLDYMLFSKRTGELVLSLWNTEAAETSTTFTPCSHLVVMSDPETIVDQWGEGKAGLDRIRTMIFSPDGSKLATATADEDLIIWNFLPEDTSRKKTYSRNFYKMPVYLDEATYGFSLR